MSQPHAVPKTDATGGAGTSRTTLLLALLALPLGLTIACSGAQDHLDPAAQEASLFFGDPHIFLDGHTYYAYGTQRSNEGILVYTSHDLKTWSGPAGVRDGFALHRDDVHGDSQFWAPEVYLMGETYHMFFSVERHMAVATAPSPMGPFVQAQPGLLADFEAIDHSLFVDDDGQKYIYFAKFRDGLEIWGAEMEEDLSAIRLETRRYLMRPEQPWELVEEGRMEVNEGPEVFKHEGLYYMLFTANPYTSQHYGIGLAWAEQPLGPWTKSEYNPVLQKQDGLVGIGHCMLFRDREGRLHMAYHAHFDEDNVSPRRAYISPIALVRPEGSRHDIIQVLEPRIVPVLSTPAESDPDSE